MSAELLGFTEVLARRAGRMILERSAGGDVAERHGAATAKSSPTDLVTELDRESEELIVQAIAAAYPDDGVLGEEGGAAPGSSGRTWVIDPIDGTTNFVYGYGSFAISIACTDGEGGLVGVVHDPVRDECFSARRGGGAALNGRRLTLGGRRAPLAEALVATGFGYRRQRRADQAQLLLGVLPEVRDIRRGGSAALDLCSVASGRVDAFYEGGLGAWDFAAGLVVALEAGAGHLELDEVLPGAPVHVVAAEPLLSELAGLIRRSAG